MLRYALPAWHTMPCHYKPRNKKLNESHYTQSSRILADQLLLALFGFIWAHCELCESIHFLCFETNTKKSEEEEIAIDRQRNTICKWSNCCMFSCLVCWFILLCFQVKNCNTLRLTSFNLRFRCSVSWVFKWFPTAKFSVFTSPCAYLTPGAILKKTRSILS